MLITEILSLLLSEDIYVKRSLDVSAKKERLAMSVTELLANFSALLGIMHYSNSSHLFFGLV